MRIYVLFISLVLFAACSSEDKSVPSEPFLLETIKIGNVQNVTEFVDVQPEDVVELTFSDDVDEASAETNVKLTENGHNVSLSFEYPAGNVARVTPVEGFRSFTTYKLIINPGVKSTSGTLLESGKVCSIQIGMDDSDKFERIPDEDLLTLVQKRTFGYFWDFGHEHSGMARERTTSGNTVTTGGTGFGVMAMLVAVERGFISRTEALQRVQKIVSFLDTECESYHGAYAHWINGATGETIPFSTEDNGADLVETAHLFQGLLCARAYFDGSDEAESNLRNDITRLWEGIEWTWFQKEGVKV